VQLSIQETQELLRIIDRNQLTVIGQELGSEFLTDYDRQLLQSYGIDPDTLYSPELSSIQTSFHFGMLAEALGAQETSTVTYPDLKEYIKNGNYIPINERQKAAVQSVKMQSFSSLKTMGGNIFSDVNNVLNDKTQAGQQEFLAQELKEGIDKRKTVTQIAHAIAEKTGDWGRNFDRIIETASQNAYEQGKVAEIQRRNPDRDPIVYKMPQGNACKHCIRLYLINGIGSQPILFKLSELIANGSNIGRKVDEWKPTVDAIHPHCRCPLFEYQEGYLWNTKTQRFDTVDPEYKTKTAAKRPLIKVMIGDKTYYL
jgi:hypothetical protein